MDVMLTQPIHSAFNDMTLISGSSIKLVDPEQP
jgi:hypothetical protein